MIRRNIFEIIAEQRDSQTDFKRLTSFFRSKPIISCGMREYSLEQFVARFCFDKWRGNRFCVDLKDFLNSAHYPDVLFGFETPEEIQEKMLIAIETVYNLWYVADNFLKQEAIEGRTWNVLPSFVRIKDMLDELLSGMNNKAIRDKEKEQVLIIENDPAVTSVVEIVDPPLAAPLLRYHHHLLRGNVEEKKKILLELGGDLEPRRGELKGINKPLEDNIFYILNNFNIRHNNTDGSKLNEYVASIKPDELESWYDDLFQMILLAYLEMDNCERNRRIKAIKEKDKSNGQA